MKVEIYEDGKPAATEELKDMEVTVLKKDDQVILRPIMRMTAADKKKMEHTLDMFSKRKARFLWVPHGWKVFVIRKEVECGNCYFFLMENCQEDGPCDKFTEGEP